MTLFCEISYEGAVVRAEGGSPGARDALHVTSDGIEGWHSTPEPKWSLTERQSGDGAHAVPGDRILYAARAVAVHMAAVAGSRAAVLSLVSLVKRAAGKPVRLRVVDGSSDTWAEGLASIEVSPSWSEGSALVDLSLDCPDPRRYGAESRVQLFPLGSGGQAGLSYGPAAAGLDYPLSYGASASDGRNSAALANAGTAPAWPVVEVSGTFGSGVRLDLSGPSGTSSVEWSGYVGAEPLVLDFLSRTASIGGLDVSRGLTSRGFAPVPPGGSLGVSLQGSGSGWATCTVRDTYI